MILPTSKLLAEVLGAGTTKGLISFGFSRCETYLILQFSDCDTTINIYELMGIMKEWAYKQGYEIRSFKIIGDYIRKGMYGCIVSTINSRKFDAEKITTIEPDTVTKACEWILENKDKR